MPKIERRTGYLTSALYFGASKLGRIFSTTSARMRLIIGLSAVPVIGIGSAMAVHNYTELMTESAERAASAITRLDLQFRHDTDRLRSALETIGGMELTPEQIGHALSLAQTVSGQRYCFLALLDSDGSILHALSPPNGGCGAVSKITPFSAYNGTLLEAVQNNISTEENSSFLRVTVPAIFLTSSETQGYLVGVIKLSRKAAYLAGNSGWQVFSDINNPLQAWVIDSYDNVRPICTDCGWKAPPAEIIAHLRRRLKNDKSGIASLPKADTGYALGTIAGGTDILVSTQRTPREQSALQVMLLEISALFLLLGIGLIGVTVAANFVLVGPLRRLTYAVQKWQMEGVFDARTTRSMPLELQRLGQAFTRATRRLSRHEKRLTKAMAHQELLMREIHHRVKNNLQIVASLLNLQASRISNPEFRAEFALARDRVRALATLHRNLYAEDRLDSLNIASFLKELCGQTLHIAGEYETGRISMEITCDEFSMSADQAVPLSLIVTELVTNSIKYAFPDERRGTISISLTRQGSVATLNISDDGVGCNTESCTLSDKTGIGLKLIRGFARQLNAEFTQSCENGTHYVFIFQLEQLNGQTTTPPPG